MLPRHFFLCFLPFMAASEFRAGAAELAQSSDTDETYWAFRRIADPQPPRVVDQQWIWSPIDQFVLSKLEALGLWSAPRAERRTLIRRVTFDLTGLPPTPEEIHAYVIDPSPTAFSRVVDRLLSSHHYGERWARRWLDLARYADNNGHGGNFAYPYSYRYRDYVIWPAS